MVVLVVLAGTILYFVIGIAAAVIVDLCHVFTSYEREPGIFMTILFWPIVAPLLLIGQCLCSMVELSMWLSGKIGKMIGGE